jgi:nucleotide-binding universal stress UspA family protein
MYEKILIALDATEADEAIIAHVAALARSFNSSVMLLHVADGWAARLFGADAVSREIDEDTAYLKVVEQRLAVEGLKVEAQLAYGEPADEIVKWVASGGCDLVAMSTHGHRFISDLLYGSTANSVRHRVAVPVLLLKARK